jgi:hypothetical protein
MSRILAPASGSPSSATAAQTLYAERLLAGAGQRTEAILTGNGTTALWAALSALGLPAHTPVLYPDLTAEAAVNAAVFAGLMPVFADVQPDTAMPSGADLAVSAAVTGAGAMVPTRLFGRQGRLPTPAPECPQIVDAAQCGVAASDLAGGLAVVVSFGPGKQFDLGGGGAVLTDDRAFAREVRGVMATLGHDPARAAKAREGLLADLVKLSRVHRPGSPSHLEAWRSSLFLHRRGYLRPARPDLADRVTVAIAGRADARRIRRARGAMLREALAGLEGIQLLDLGPADVPWRVSFRAPWIRDRVMGALVRAGFGPSRLFAPVHRITGRPDHEYPRSTALSQDLVNLDPACLGGDPAAVIRRLQDVLTPVAAALLEQERVEA